MKEKLFAPQQQVSIKHANGWVPFVVFDYWSDYRYSPADHL